MQEACQTEVCANLSRKSVNAREIEPLKIVIGEVLPNLRKIFLPVAARIAEIKNGIIYFKLHIKGEVLC
jgi:hypothetical protein